MADIVLQTFDLTKRYASLLAVDHLSLEICEGEVFGFLGPNGAGKTTSIRMMCGLLKPDSGEVRVHGKLVANGSEDVRAKVGVCPQNIVLWERLTCLEQLQFIGEMYSLSAAVARKNGLKLLQDLDLSDKTHKQARTLSGGMQRRLNLAMALVHDPQIVILDEPEAGLDPQSRVKVREYIQSLAHRKTVILTTHNMDEADRVADRIAIIDHGHLLVQDTPEKLKQSLGEGDLIEIQLSVAPQQDFQLLLQDLASAVRFNSQSSLLSVRSLNAVAKLPVILERLEGIGVKPGAVNIRANTLEDVFIHLTGRGLRE